MKLSAKGAIEIISHEGICLEPYLDSVGVWTIGVGITKGAGVDPLKLGKITLQQAVDLFLEKVTQYSSAVDRLGRAWTQPQYDALTSFCYNCGPGNLASLCRGRVTLQVGSAFSLYLRPPEIAGRRKKEQTLFTKGVYSSTGKVLVFPVRGNHPWYGGGKQVDIKPYFKGE